MKIYIPVRVLINKFLTLGQLPKPLGPTFPFTKGNWVSYPSAKASFVSKSVCLLIMFQFTYFESLVMS